MKSKLFVLSAASGAGKTTLKDLVLPKFSNFSYSVSATTRPPRPGELDGIHYFFKTHHQFDAMIRNNELIEYNQVHNNFYGTPKAFIDECIAQNKNLILDLDVYGKINFDKYFPEAIGIMILPPDPLTLEKRLRARNTDSDEVINIRLKNAEKEIEFAKLNGKYDYWIINADLNQATSELYDIIALELNRP
jgi:guanylate kinase